MGFYNSLQNIFPGSATLSLLVMLLLFSIALVALRLLLYLLISGFRPKKTTRPLMFRVDENYDFINGWRNKPGDNGETND